MRIVIETKDTGERAVVTADATTGGAAAPGLGPVAAPAGLAGGDVTDAGPPAHGQPLGAPAATAVGGEAVDAGPAPDSALVPARVTSRVDASGEQAVDAGGAPGVD